MRFFRSVTFQIWLPYAVVFMLLTVAVSIYYPARQGKVLLAQKQAEMSEMARSISAGIELSLEAGNFSGLEKTLRYFAGNHEHISVLIFSEAKQEGEQEIIAYFPQSADAVRLRTDSLQYITVSHPFVSSVFNGTVQIFFPKSDFEEIIWGLNKPVFFLLAIAFVATAFLFYFVALRVSRPISEITQYAKGLIPVAAFQLVQAEDENEIKTLRHSLRLLKESLDFQNDQNKRLTEGLEEEVRKRTTELVSAVDKLSDAQTFAKIGDFQYLRETDSFILSANLASLMSVGGQDETSFQRFLQCVYPGAQEKLKAVFLESPADGMRQTFDIRLKDGKRWVALNAVCQKNEQTGETLITGTIQDITDRKQAESEVHKLSLVARLSTNGILITDTKKKIQWANHSAELLTGYSLAEMQGKTPSLFQFEETDQDTLAFIKSELNQEKPLRTEIQNRSKSGRKYWLELHIEPFFDEYGKLEGYLAIEVDITDRKRYEDELKSALVKEKELSGMKSRFITMTSHEFRTPLTTIHANLELLEFFYAQNERPEKVGRYVGRINKEVSRLTNLINDILLLGRIDAGKIRFNPVMLSLDELISEIVQHQHFGANDERGIQLKVSGTPRSLHADPVVMNHIFFNLFSNALKYSPGASSPECRIHFESDRVQIAVQDFGLGIPADDLPHIFESFHRGANVANIQGTGLGLQITRQFVAMHDGAIALESKESEGTTVTIEFPFTGNAQEVEGDEKD